VVIDDFDLVRMSISPFKADSPLVVDADGVLSASISRQCLQPIWSELLSFQEHVPMRPIAAGTKPM
jgi:hypothetical protein